MKQIVFSFIFVAALLCSCDGMYDNFKDYAGEVVYPAKFDTITGRIGFERVEIDLIKAGRIPSNQIKMGKAKKTVVEYDNKVVVIDSLVSWLNITGLTDSKLYRFNVYTIDEYENKSVPQEIALIPYTSADLDNLGIASPRVMSSPSSAVVDWPNGISSVLLNYYGLSYRYTDKDGEVREGERGADNRFFVGNLEAGEPISIEIEYKIIPKVNNTAILDTIYFKKPLVISLPTPSTPFSPSERDVLLANGVTSFTANDVAGFTKLTYPMHASSLQDIFYFSNLKELDLTGGDLFVTPLLTYDGNGAHGEVGGVKWLPFMRKVSDLTDGQQTLLDLLESGLIEKIRYVPNSMGLDNLLAPYVESGIVELVDLPAEVLIPQTGFFVDGLVQATSFRMDIVCPATDAPSGENLQYVYKVTLRASSASFILALPKEYRFNIHEYPYLKIGVYAPAKSVFSGGYDAYQRIWPRFMNRLWAFSGNSDFGQESWAPSPIPISDADLQKWTEITVDLTSALNRHNRVIVMNVGGEPGGAFPSPVDITYYFANIRFAKER